ncbi:MAG: PKD domain-containing protein [Bacteroidetes bacterium]|nr:PKD domain-containing protein [Bacteroidota bacterium]
MLLCNSELRFGNWWSGGTFPFKGKLDDIRWYNRALNQDEVTALFDNFSGTGASSADFGFTQNICAPQQINFSNVSNLSNITWDFGDGNTSNLSNPVHIYPVYGTYNVKLTTTNSYGCLDSITKPVNINFSQADVINTKDTFICAGQSVTIHTQVGAGFCWQNPGDLSNPSQTDQFVTPAQTTTYYLNSQLLSNNLVVNGDFTQGNTGFTSDYSSAFPNTLEAEYWVDNNPHSWNTNFNS